MWWVCSGGIPPPSQTSQELNSTGNTLGSIPGSWGTGAKLFCLLAEVPPLLSLYLPEVQSRPCCTGSSRSFPSVPAAAEGSLAELPGMQWSPKAALNVSQLFTHNPHTCCLGSVQLNKPTHCALQELIQECAVAAQVESSKNETTKNLKSKSKASGHFFFFLITIIMW